MRMEKRAGKNEVKKKEKMELSMRVKLKLSGGLARNSSLALWSVIRHLRFFGRAINTTVRSHGQCNIGANRAMGGGIQEEQEANCVACKHNLPFQHSTFGKQAWKA